MCFLLLAYRVSHVHCFFFLQLCIFFIYDDGSASGLYYLRTRSIRPYSLDSASFIRETWTVYFTVYTLKCIYAAHFLLVRYSVLATGTTHFAASSEQKTPAGPGSVHWKGLGFFFFWPLTSAYLLGRVKCLLLSNPFRSPVLPSLLLHIRLFIYFSISPFINIIIIIMALNWCNVRFCLLALFLRVV